MTYEDLLHIGVGVHIGSVSQRHKLLLKLIVVSRFNRN